jgi:hypothetical protein
MTSEYPFRKTPSLTRLLCLQGLYLGTTTPHPPHGNLLPPPPNQFRPVSMFSFTGVHSPNKEDDTMISVSLCQYPKLITSLRTLSSRCLAVATFDAGLSNHHLARESRNECKLPQQQKALHDSSNVPCIIEKPSIASPRKFGADDQGTKEVVRKKGKVSKTAVS